MSESTRTAVVSGANRGIGTEIARQLSAAGLNVIPTARNPEAADDVAQELGLTFQPLDVTNRDSIDRLAEAVGPIDVLVNNAGVSLSGFDAGVVQETMAVNVYGAMHLTDRFLPAMAPGARVVMVSSGMGALDCVSPALRTRFLDPALTRDDLHTLLESFRVDVQSGQYAAHGWPGSAYRVSKVGLNALTRIFAQEIEADSRDIAVNAVCPGWVQTDMGGPGAPRTVEDGADTPVWAALLPGGGPNGGFFRDRQAVDW